MRMVMDIEELKRAVESGNAAAQSVLARLSRQLKIK